MKEEIPRNLDYGTFGTLVCRLHWVTIGRAIAVNPTVSCG